MNKIKLLVVGAALLVPSVALGATKLPANYRGVYCYPTGSYWQAQIKANPAYYAANNAYYQSTFGAGSIYC